MDSEQGQSESASRIKKKYGRDELFRLAQSMRVDNKPLFENLDKYQNANWSAYNLDKIETRNDNEESRFRLVRSKSNIGRQKCEITHEYNSLLDQKNDFFESRRNFLNHKHNRISRMTSSPSINYNTRSKVENLPNNLISNQVKAKYVKLIETLSGPSQIRNKSIQRLNLSRTSSFNGERPVVRPTNLFGSLRKENPKQPIMNSGEPLSLPYIPTNDHEFTNLPSGKLAITKDLYDDVSSPIKRISSSRDRTSEKMVDDEDDDFDITSLLSITVLSDIKTIRQDTQSCGRTRPPSGFVRSTRNRNQETPMRPLTRARTATEFTYESRQNLSEIGLSQEINHDDNNSINYQFQRNSYNWYKQQDFFKAQEVAQGVERYEDVKETKPVDESVARIIETFKTQVKARAVADGFGATAGACSDTKTDPITAKGIEQAKRVHSFAESVSCAKIDQVESDPKSFEENSRQSAPSSKGNIVSTHSNKGGELANDEYEEKIEEPTSEAKTGSNSKLNELTATTENQPIIRRISNIPRLISLHNNQRPLKQDKLDECREKSLPKDRAEEPKVSAKKALIQSAASKTNTKFVSQYKILRGKSLADEVNETPK